MRLVAVRAPKFLFQCKQQLGFVGKGAMLNQFKTGVISIQTGRNIVTSGEMCSRMWEKQTPSRTFHRPDYLHARDYRCFSLSVQQITCGAYSPFWALASLKMGLHPFPSSTPLLHPRSRWISAVFLRTTSTRLGLSFPTTYPYPHRWKLVSSAMHNITDIS